jgi:hypothetical protein
MEIEVVVDASASIGESPTWVSSENALYWIDIKKPALYRYDAKTRGQRSWLMTSDIGAFALASHPPGAVVALRYGIFRIEFDSGALTKLVDPPFDPTLFRFNEGACDGFGRFWIGVMFDRPEDHRFTVLPWVTACDPNPTLRNCIMAWRGVQTDAVSICRIATKERCLLTLSIRRAGRSAYPPCSRRFRKHWVCPMARLLIVRADIGAPCMVVADCGAIRRLAQWTATSSCL